MASPARPPVVIRFGEFELNATSGELRKAGLPLKIHPQPFRVLSLLAERQGQIVTREEIQRTLWGDNTFVDFEAGINFCIKQIRDAIADDADKPRYIETIPRRGYRFIAAVALVEPTKHPIPFVRSPSSYSEPQLAAGHVTEFVSPHEIQVLPKPLSPVLAARSRRMAGAAIVGLALIAILAVATAFYFRRPAKLTEKDSIVLADFTNTTGDAVFDGTLRQGLSVQLEQSPFLSLVSEDRVVQTLRLMNQPPDAKLTPQLARDLCQRIGSAAVLTGSISSLGSQYVLGLRAVSCNSGETLAEEQVQASRKEDVLKSLSYASAQLREKLGESLSTVENLDTPLDQATTPSLEALQAYSLGRREQWGSGGYAAAIPFLRQATRLDPNFAMAYARLGTNYANLGEMSLGAENIRKAYKLRDHVSQRERFYIESHYYLGVIGDLEKARQTYELWMQTYPRDTSPITNVGITIYPALGQYDKSLSELRVALRLDASSATYASLVAAYLSLDRLDEAQATVKEALTKNLDIPLLRAYMYRLAFLQDDTSGMAQQVAWAEGKPGVHDALLALESDTAGYSGRMTNARDLSRQAVASAEHVGEKETAATYQAAAALREAFSGNAAQARIGARAALALSAGRNVQYLATLALASAGEVVRAQSLADDLKKRFPEDTLVQYEFLPTIYAQLTLARNDIGRLPEAGASKAIVALQPASAYEMGFGFPLYPVYVRGRAHLQAHRGHEAASEFQKILDHRGIVANDPIGALAHLGLARAYAMQSDTLKARAAYQDFLTLWKDADPDIPVLKQAKSEYAKLQ